MKDAAELLLLAVVIAGFIAGSVLYFGGVEAADALHRALVRMLGGMR